jgi:hypothetical protein
MSEPDADETLDPADGAVEQPFESQAVGVAGGVDVSVPLSVPRSGSDTIVTEFMFIFDGICINFDVFSSSYKMQRVEFGKICPDNGLMYCVMKLHNSCGFCCNELINVINAYNQQASDMFQLKPQQELIGQVMEPVFYTRKFNPKHPVWRQLTADRKNRPTTYRPWTNRINNPPWM